MSQMQRKPGFWDRLIGREAAEPPKPAADPAASRSEGTPDFTTATGADPVPAQARGAPTPPAPRPRRPAGGGGRTKPPPEPPAKEMLPPEFPGAAPQPVGGGEPQGAAP